MEMIFEVWTCKGREMYQVSRMFIFERDAKKAVAEMMLDENYKDVEIWVRVWKYDKERREYMTDMNYQVW